MEDYTYKPESVYPQRRHRPTEVLEAFEDIASSITSAYKRGFKVLTMALPKSIRDADNNSAYTKVEELEKDDAATTPRGSSDTIPPPAEASHAAPPRWTQRLSTILLIFLGWFYLIFILSFPILLLYILISSSLKTLAPLPPKRGSLPFYGKHPMNCGKSQQEARERGCKFDPMSFTWLQPPCYNATFVDLWLSSRPSPPILGGTHWAQHRNETTLEAHGWITEEEVKDGKFDQGWVTWEYHRTHCAWTYRKVVHEVNNGGGIDGYVAGEKHTRHCSEILLQGDGGEGEDGWNSRWDVEFPECWVTE